VYPAAVIRDSKNANEAIRFLEYLRGADATRVFTRFGFTTNPP
jgi:molybdate transport system substrate-binding protein